MRSQALIFAICFGATACATVPPTMDPVAFQTELTLIDTNPSALSVDKQLTRLLARTDLTVEQRAMALLARGNKRLDMKLNIPGAIEDFDAYLVLSPNSPRAATVNRRKLFASEEIEAAERRLAQLQNLSDWFDDKVLMGDIAAGAARYRTSGLTPNPVQLYLLRESGYVCRPEEAVESEPVHRHGDVPDHVEGAVWCPDPSVS